MKITNVLTDTNVGGAGVQVATVAGALADKYDIEIIIPKGSAIKRRLEATGAAIVELPISGDRSFSPREIGIFYSYFKKNPTDVIHTHAALSARLAATLAGVPVRLSTRHCAYSDKNKSKVLGIERKIYDLCTDLTVSTADFATKNLEDEGVPREKIVTIRNGVEKRRKSTEEEKRWLRATLGIPEGAKILGSCARLEWVKGQDLLLRALKDILAANENVYCLFVGDGSLAAEYKRTAAAQGILSRVRFCGFAEDPTPYQNLFYLNVNASRGTETSCLASSECMSLGIPTVASDFGGNTEMISHGEDGLIFKADDYKGLGKAISTALEDRELYSRMAGAAAKKFDEQFSLGVMKDKYHKLYQRCAGGRRGITTP